MNKCFHLFIAIALLATAMACGGSGKGRALVSIGNDSITEGDLELLSKINPRLKGQIATEFGKKKILENLVEQELFYQAALKQGIHRKPDVQDKIEIYKKVIIAQEYLDAALEERAKKFYEGHKDEYEKLKLSHILVKWSADKKSKIKRSEKEALDLANSLKGKIDGGADFAAVAKEASDDDVTKTKGGDLGLASKNEARLTRRGYGPLLEKAFTMKVGEAAGPIKTEEGYHIITVTSGSELQPFDAVAQTILFNLRTTGKDDILKELKEKFPVAYNEEKKATEPQVTPQANPPPSANPTPDLKAEGGKEVTPPQEAKPAEGNTSTAVEKK